MTLELYDLAGADDRLQFSPFCWRVRMALLHKGLDFVVHPWRFSAREATAASGHASVPVLRDGPRWIGDSWDIARYLDEAYPERPPLMAGSAGVAHARLVAALCGSALFPAAVAVAAYQVHRLLDPVSQAYFRATREQMLGRSLEAIHAEEGAGRAGLAAALAPFTEVLQHADYLGGEAPSYADYLVFGVLKWCDIVSTYDPIDHATPVGHWFDRVSALHDAYAARVPTVRTVEGTSA